MKLGNKQTKGKNAKLRTIFFSKKIISKDMKANKYKKK